jgi:hypothetical protein
LSEARVDAYFKDEALIVNEVSTVIALTFIAYAAAQEALILCHFKEIDSIWVNVEVYMLWQLVDHARVCGGDDVEE